MKLELLELSLENFKNYRQFSSTPAGRSMDIFGRNHVGKTPLADAYFWLLFGRDTLGKSDSHILPEDEHGVPFDGLVASVTGKFRKDGGEEFTLQRDYKQKFSHKKGEVERSATGNTTDFFINGVPKSKTEYQAFVAGICDDKTFAMLTDPNMFPEKMAWKERREFLIKSFAPNIDDREIINAHKELQPLGGYIGFKSVADYAAQTDYERKKTQKEKDEIPGRIDEAEKAKPADLPKDEDAHNAITLQKNKIQLEGQINAVRSGESASALRRQISEIQAKIAKAETDYTRQQMMGNSGTNTEIASLRSQIDELERSVNYAENVVIPDNTGRTERLSKDIENLRNQWIKTDSSEFDPSNNICPTCGQEYPLEKQKQIQGDFNDRKARTLGKLESNAAAKKSEFDDAKKEIDTQKQNILRDKQTIAELRTRLEKSQKQITEPAPFSSTAEYAELKQQLDEAKGQLNNVTQSTDQRIAMLQEQLSGVTDELDAIKARAANQGIVDRQNQRIEELKKRETELSQFLATYAKGLDLAEKFELQKAQDIEEKVNSAFRTVRWKLFKHLQNGGNEPCCEACVQTAQGIREYNGGAGTSEKLNAGLDIINTLSRVLDISVPLWIDNAEGVTDYEPVNTQVFRLYVSGKDKKLRVEERTA